MSVKVLTSWEGAFPMISHFEMYLPEGICLLAFVKEHPCDLPWELEVQ